MKFWQSMFQASACVALQATQAPNPPHVAIPRLDKAPSMSRDADLSTWQGAMQVDQFSMIMPDDKGVNRWPTRAYLAFGPDAFYAAVECQDPEPEKVRAWRHKHDEWGDQELAMLDLDPSGKGQSCMRFVVTPLGSQMEGLVQDGKDEDFTYDCLWDSVGVRTTSGYVVKMRVPYSSLRRLPGEWGVRIFRVIPRERRYGTVWPPMSLDIPCDICQMAKASGAPEKNVGSPFLLIPFATMRREESRERGTFGKPENTTRLGMDMRYSGTSVTLDGTIRPDFSNVEADVDPLQINSRFKVFYPEKRPFFLEGMDLLGIQGAQRQFFSRSVLDPLYGLKASGHASWASWSVLHARDQVGSDSLMSDGASGVDGRATRDTAATTRFRFDDRGSGLSLLATDKTLLGSDNAGGRSAGVYWTQWLGSEFQFIGSAMQAQSRLPQESGETLVQRGTATSTQLNWNQRNWSGSISTQATSPNLVLVSGFVNLQGFRLDTASFGWSERWNKGSMSQAKVQFRATQLHGWDGTPMERAVGFNGYLETTGRWALTWGWDPSGRAWEKGRSVAMRNFYLNPAWNRHAEALLWSNFSWSRNIDLETGDPARFHTYALGSDGNISSFNYSVSARISELNRESDGQRLVRARQITTSAGYQFPRSFYIKLQAFVVRYDGRDPSTVDKYLKLLMGWQPNAFTHAYIGWSGRVQQNPDLSLFQERMSERGLFAKFAYAIQF